MQSTYNTVKAKVEAGKTYYAYLGGATAQIWKVYYSQLNKKTVVDWESVAKPVISKSRSRLRWFYCYC